jgi:hypothetical protein
MTEHVFADYRAQIRATNVPSFGPISCAALNISVIAPWYRRARRAA